MNENQTDISTKVYDKSLRRKLDFPFWFTHVSVIFGWILMPSIISVIFFGAGVVSTIVYVINVGTYAKETGGNPTQWSMLTLLGVMLIGPFGMWFSYLRALDEMKKVKESAE